MADMNLLTYVYQTLRKRHSRNASSVSLLRRAGFTLIELLAAIVILVIVAAISMQALSGTLFAWKRGTEVIDSLQHGDFALEQLVSALNSTIYFYNDRQTYAFLVEKESAYGYPADTLSFVTSSSAFMPVDSPFIRGPHRLELTIDNDEHGDPALFARPMPAIPDPVVFAEEYDGEPFIVARSIAGLEILFWDAEQEDWIEEWEEDNSVPDRILITMYVISDDPSEDPMEFSQIVEIPVFDSVAQQIAGPSASSSNNGGGFGGAPGGNRGGGFGGAPGGNRGGTPGGNTGGGFGGAPGGNTGGGFGGAPGGNTGGGFGGAPGGNAGGGFGGAPGGNGGNTRTR